MKNLRFEQKQSKPPKPKYCKRCRRTLVTVTAKDISSTKDYRVMCKNCYDITKTNENA